MRVWPVPWLIRFAEGGPLKGRLSVVHCYQKDGGSFLTAFVWARSFRRNAAAKVEVCETTECR